VTGTSGNEPSLGGQGDEFATSARLGGERAIVYLAAMLQSDDLPAQHRAVQALRNTGSERAASILASFVKTSSPRASVYPVAATALSVIGGDTALITLLEILVRQLEPNREYIIRLLGRWQDDPRIIEPLCQVLGDPLPRVRRAAQEYLSQTHSETAPYSVIRLLDHPDEEIRAEAAWILSKWLHDPNIIPPLVRLLASSDQQTHFTAASLLGKIGTPEALAAIAAWEASQQGKADA
jgi:HEAT repeat protein